MRSYELTGMIGRYVSMERPATDEEIAAGEPLTVGMAGVVTEVRDTAVGARRGVEIAVDYGYAWTVFDDEQNTWRFTISARSPR